ncbi:aspartate/glutamate racemase family protein [Leptolyngbyaceae cyanobacterium CCMR0082]|uniref:Hydantoin racemase n=2 Tax=Adonisia turfae TaxID=2950184 RepID=A0A6M0S577_9CYAN|nr:aspartate/glutamate racemase family protein [Adonisia turfae]MDV3350314.1 aspartate/glutamate racemase family protein [Leptothoe sp. LEGE 181152]NEZ60330.1 aspartate/glutamate racemase family protein [Adonisia turfae CCMR0081]NEZ63654.1 aspartate/glutamate racemase family protein [Adonisia turfae CCMR0082]
MAQPTCHIKIINGNTCQPMTANINASAQAIKFLNTEIITVQPQTGPESIESFYDEYLAIPGILEQIILDTSSDAFILACWGDPGIEAAREITSKPVVGIAEASLYMANMLAAKWSVVTTLHRVRDMVEKTIQKTGLTARCASVRTTKLSVLDTEQDRTATLDILIKASQLAIQQDGAEAICLGCAGMSGLEKQLEARLGVPVIDAVAAAVKMAESLVHLGKSTSKHLTYRLPEQKEIKGYNPHFQAQSFYP